MTQYHKTAHTVSPNELDQISLPQASMTPMTIFHHSQFHCEYEQKWVKYYDKHFLS